MTTTSCANTTEFVIADCEGDWVYGDDETQAQERNRALHTHLAKHGVQWEEKTEEMSSTYNFSHQALILSPKEFASLTVHGISFSNVRMQELTVPATATQNFTALEDKITELLSRTDSFNFNDKCEVHMPGQALSLYNETVLMENACTDALQANLNDGWRIICACPQPDQRRPDYILGRFNPTIPH